jgi:hypothetical protein
VTLGVDSILRVDCAADMQCRLTEEAPLSA